MYTSLVISCRLKPETPSKVIAQIQAMLQGCHVTSKETVGTGRNAFNSTSSVFPEAAHVFKATRYPDGFSLLVCASLKNYEDEIETTLRWLRPHVGEGHGCDREWWAVVTYEEADTPTIHYLDKSATGAD